MLQFNIQGSLVDYHFNNKGSWFGSLLNKCPSAWLQNKRKADNAEGLWRIHDDLYDVTDFIDVHPGGRFWLEETKGTDITELFESHHVISDVPEMMIKRFKIREAVGSRRSNYTFDDKGFYRTVKRRVREVLKTIPKKQSYSSFHMDSLMIITFILICLTNYISSYSFVILIGIFTGLSLTSVHNYIHTRDNWRMHYADILWFPCRIARIVHIFSHHAFTNTCVDLQLTFSQPIVNVFPQPKGFSVKYLSLIYTPLLLWPAVTYAAQLLRILDYWSSKNRKIDKKSFLFLILPTLTYLFSHQTLFGALLTWSIITMVESVVFSVLAFTTNHVHPNIYMEGDLTRSEKLDWGINQLDTVNDRQFVTGNKFLVLISFGDHALHHLFPTLDHGLLHHLYPIVEETLKEFNIKGIRMTSHADLFVGFFKRMKIEIPNLDAASLGYTK
ncbi:hypothetical protein RI129_010394 [Pyrocoelia pectoralis]|uniref:Cytochrome b5 heme-binding domain-containing protein n=1 Tax=Pyrocoelia pectoralis TaxID=417401 RepID=A0AAN7V6N5_9COLE